MPRYEPDLLVRYCTRPTTWMDMVSIYSTHSNLYRQVMNEALSQT